MEAYTSGIVTGLARRAWLDLRGDLTKYGVDFERDGKQWRMYAWESQIEMCRAMGRGALAARRNDGAQ